MRMQKKLSGFTIVELLIVIVVIAILATISVVVYRGIQDRANDTTVKSDLSSAAKALEMIKVERGKYPSSTESDWQIISNFKFSKSAYRTGVHNALYCLDPTTDTYAIGAISKSGTSYILTKNGIAEGVSVSPNSVCTATGSTANWGDATIMTRHGYFPAGTAPSYINGWSSFWSWTN